MLQKVSSSFRTKYLMDSLLALLPPSRRHRPCSKAHKAASCGLSCKVMHRSVLRSPNSLRCQWTRGKHSRIMCSFVEAGITTLDIVSRPVIYEYLWCFDKIRATGTFGLDLFNRRYQGVFLSILICLFVLTSFETTPCTEVTLQDTASDFE